MELPKVSLDYINYFTWSIPNQFFNQSILDDRNTHILVIEWADGGSLRNYLHSNFSNMMGDDKLRFAKEITRGVMCLHQKGIIHRDLVINSFRFNPPNFLNDFRQILIITKYI